MSSELSKLIDTLQKSLSQLNLTVEQEEELCARMRYPLQKWVKNFRGRQLLNDAQKRDNETK